MNTSESTDASPVATPPASASGDVYVLLGLVCLVIGGGGFGLLTSIFPTVDHRGPIYSGFLLTWMWVGVPVAGVLGYLIWKQWSASMVLFVAAMGFAIVSLVGIDLYLMANALGAPRTLRMVELPVLDRHERNSSGNVRYDVRFACPDQPDKICILGVDSVMFTKAIPHETMLVGPVYRGRFGYDIWLGEPKVERRETPGSPGTP